MDVTGKKCLGTEGTKINRIIKMEYKQKKKEIEFIPLIYNQNFYGMIFFVFYLFNCRIHGILIPFMSNGEYVISLSYLR